MRRTGARGAGVGARLASTPGGARRPAARTSSHSSSRNLIARHSGYSRQQMSIREWVDFFGEVSGRPWRRESGSVASLVPSVHHNDLRRACQNFRVTDEGVKVATTVAPAERQATRGSCAAPAVDNIRSAVTVDLISPRTYGGPSTSTGPRSLEFVMAKRKAQEPTGPGTAMILVLVFFVLATLILGVTTYLGFEGQSELQKQAKDAQDK